jgi:nicotinate phosphoribosyltransferase
MVYKLVRYAGRDILKLSEGKRTWVGEKQVWRVAGERDVIGLWEERGPDGAEPLLQPVMRDGKLLRPHPPLASARERCAAEVARLPQQVKRLRGAAAYPVDQSSALRSGQAAAERIVAPGRPLSR